MDKAPTAVISDAMAVSDRPSDLDTFTAIAERGAAAVSAERCLIAIGVNGTERVIRAPNGDSRWDHALEAALAALQRKLGAEGVSAPTHAENDAAASNRESSRRIALSDRELDGIARAAHANDTDAPVHLAGAAFIDGGQPVRIALVAPFDRTRGEIEASLELIARANFAELELSAVRASLEFWRRQGARTGREANGATRALARERRAAQELDTAASAARGFLAHERFARFGALISSYAGFDQWIVAIEEDGAASVAAVSPRLKNIDKSFKLAADRSALARCISSHAPVSRPGDGDGDLRALCEDALFRSPYVCIPFEAGAIALASAAAQTPAAVLRAHAMVERLDPIVKLWVMEMQAARRDALVKQLAMRMFAAIDEERSRIARDLHDDQAQLIAAAELALKGGREEAREIFKQVGSELRRRTRELRPPLLGNATLAEAIGREFMRLEAARVSARLVYRDGAGAAMISRPVQQLCFQVTREAISNVIRHANATSVEVAIELTNGIARVSITDNGRGIHINRRADGIGLAGIRERLELMGGCVTLESKSGRTMLVAEIPELM
jgi:signal transduction histidine kinase